MTSTHAPAQSKSAGSKSAKSESAGSKSAKSKSAGSPGIDATHSDGAADALATYCLRQGDRALILAQRLLEMVTHAPEIEEDMALSNLALDLIGQARALYTYAGEVEHAADPSAPQRTEDDFAFTRDDAEFTNPLLVEQPNRDFAHVIVRQFLHDAYALTLWQTLAASSDPTIAAIAARAVKETAYHLRHSRGWLVRLGDGTDESHQRTVDAIDRLWRFTAELFEADEVERQMLEAGIGADPDALRATWETTVAAALGEATIPWPADVVMMTGGRRGAHGEAFSYLIGEMQVVARAHPGANW